jgi:transcriptional regulator of acetoin/glycerol metabolism
VFHFAPSEERELYHLALSELYNAEVALAAALPRHALLSPVESVSEIDTVAKALERARDDFLHDDMAVPLVRPRIVNSWRRSRALGADLLRDVVPEAMPSLGDLAERRERNERLLTAAAPALERLSGELLDSGYVVAVADATGCILAVNGERDALRRFSRINFEPGGDLSEASCGTNAIGTALGDGRPLQLMGAEHLNGVLTGLTCTAAPVRDPATGQIIGVLDITADYRAVRPPLLALMSERAIEIEEHLAAAT